MNGSDVLWHGFTITHVKDCIADPSKNRVVAEFSDDISPVFPYLNAIIANLMYTPAVNSVTVKRGERILTFYPRVAKMAKVAGAEDATTQLAWFQELCNDTWQRREEITPLYERRKLLGPLDVYRLLPGLNCKECGEATCMAFAFGLLMDKHQVPECPRLVEDEYAEGGRRLAELLSI
jgi:ArsR family metal-binding transcriptional regulator